MEVASLLTSAKVAYQIAAGINALKNEVDRNQAVSRILEALIQVQSEALSLQENQLQLGKTIQELEKERDRLKDWQIEKSRYELMEIARGVFARVEKGSVGNWQSTQKFCATCFEQNKKAPLQQEDAQGRRVALLCHLCKSTIVFNSYLKTSVDLDETTQQILKLLFDTGKTFTASEIASLKSMEAEIARYHLDILANQQFVNPSVGYGPGTYTLSIRGRAYVMEKMKLQAVTGQPGNPVTD